MENLETPNLKVVAKKINPYIAGNPVGNTEAFVGRFDIVREVLQIVRKPHSNSLVLYGQRRIGKTSVLQHLLSELREQNNFIPIYFDLQDKSAWPLSRVIQDLADNIALSLNKQKPDLGDKPERMFSDSWFPDLLEGLSEDSALVLLFDEFDVLADPVQAQAGAELFPYLRNLINLNTKQLNYVFVIGRNVKDLTSAVLSLFKSIPTKRVSLLDKDDTENLVRLSEKNGSLPWSDKAVERIWQYTHGHAFLIQQLCSHVWDQAYDHSPDKASIIKPGDVDNVINDVLEASRNTLEWLWGGLGPAERVVASALAEAGAKPISQEALEELLHESGVRVVIRELQDAPKLLQDWDLIEPVNGGFSFRVELLRQWIAQYKPLRRVQEELDRIEPVADNLYQAAIGLYKVGGHLEEAIGPLQQAVRLNPNHVGASQLLADIYLAQGNSEEASVILERLMEFQPGAARSRLKQALMEQANKTKDDDRKLPLFERIIEIDPKDSEALSGYKSIWKKRGEKAEKDGELETALEAYRHAGMDNQVYFIEKQLRQKKLANSWKVVDELQAHKNYSEALEHARNLAKQYPDEKDWGKELELIERKNHLGEIYQGALGALETGDQSKAQKLLIEILNIEPYYEEAARYMLIAVTGEDVSKIKDNLEREREKVKSLHLELNSKEMKEKAYIKPLELNSNIVYSNKEDINAETIKNQIYETNANTAIGRHETNKATGILEKELPFNKGWYLIFISSIILISIIIFASLIQTIYK